MYKWCMGQCVVTDYAYGFVSSHRDDEENHCFQYPPLITRDVNNNCLSVVSSRTYAIRARVDKNLEYNDAYEFV